MLDKAKILLSAVLVGLLALAVYQQSQLLGNQKAQMKQQFHSDGIALVSLFGEDGLRKLESATDPSDLSSKEGFATGLLIQRFIVAYWIRPAFTPDEWQQMVVDDGRVVMRSQLLRTRWKKIKKWYPKDIQAFFDSTFIDAIN